MVKRTFWRAGRISLGVAFLILGVVGLFLPFLQGILFIVIGLTILSPHSRTAHRMLGWVKSRFNEVRMPSWWGTGSEGANDGR